MGTLNKLRIGLTGSTGFIGAALASELPRRHCDVKVLLRHSSAVIPGCSTAVIGDLRNLVNLDSALEGLDAIVHTAAITSAKVGISEAELFAINTRGTMELAAAAKKAGVRRFVFFSSISAQSGPTAKSVLVEGLAPEPVNAYGRSKLAAEQGLANLGLDFVSLRPVSVYGLEPKGKMNTLLQMARLPLPLPFSGLPSRRSICFLDNLIAAVQHVLSYPAPLSRAFIVADPDALSLAEIVTALRRGLRRKPNLFSVPQPVLQLLASLSGRRHDYERFALASLVASPDALLASGWKPCVRTEDWMAALAANATRRIDEYRKPLALPPQLLNRLL